MKRIIRGGGNAGDEPKIEEFDEEVEKEELKKKMNKVKEVFHVWEQLNMSKTPLQQWGRCPCDHAAKWGLSHTVKVPQTHFVAGVSGHSCCATETRYAQCTLCRLQRGAAYGGGGGDEGAFWPLAIFSRSSRYLELNASGVAGLHNSFVGMLWTYTVTSVNPFQNNHNTTTTTTTTTTTQPHNHNNTQPITPPTHNQ